MAGRSPQPSHSRDGDVRSVRSAYSIVAALCVVDLTIRAMLAAMDVGWIDAEPRVRQPGPLHTRRKSTHSSLSAEAGTSPAAHVLALRKCMLCSEADRRAHLRGPREGAMDDQDGESAEEHVEADFVESIEGVQRIDLACTEAQCECQASAGTSALIKTCMHACRSSTHHPCWRRSPRAAAAQSCCRASPRRLASPH